jgi:mycothiol synthase
VTNTAVSTSLSPAETESVKQLVARAENVDGFRPVSDQFWADLIHPGSRRRVAASIRQSEISDLAGYAQASSPDGSPSGATWTVEVVVHPDMRDKVPEIGRALLVAIERAVAEDGAATLLWLVQGPSPDHESTARALDFTIVRRLHQMRRSLPASLAFELVTRPFDPARDVDEWLRVNSRAFAWNPDQGTWTEETLRSRMDEPWFDPSGFLIHERDGRMAGFCWTKVHEDTQPRLGEIYVIGVDPDFQGHGLGRRLTLAGLASLADRGIRTGMLFVDGDNVAALKMYDALGFQIHRTDAMYEKRITA